MTSQDKRLSVCQCNIDHLIRVMAVTSRRKDGWVFFSFLCLFGVFFTGWGGGGRDYTNQESVALRIEIMQNAD